jgi:hypothetical protein
VGWEKLARKLAEEALGSACPGALAGTMDELADYVLDDPIVALALEVRSGGGRHRLRRAVELAEALLDRARAPRSDGARGRVTKRTPAR